MITGAPDKSSTFDASVVDVAVEPRLRCFGGFLLFYKALDIDIDSTADSLVLLGAHILG
jgi:hypothetical protein